jgi:hypothetical protein
MDDAIRQAIADLSALIKGADSKDTERIREMSGDMRNSPLDDMKKGPPFDTER